MINKSSVIFADLLSEEFISPLIRQSRGRFCIISSRASPAAGGRTGSSGALVTRGSTRRVCAGAALAGGPAREWSPGQGGVFVFRDRGCHCWVPGAAVLVS